jgi:hypothetical protein
LELLKGDVKKSLLIAAHNSAGVLAHQGAQNGVLTKEQFETLSK